MAEPDLPTDSRSSSRPAEVAAEVAMAVATGVVTTYLPVQRWGRSAQWTLHGAMGTLAAGLTAWAVRHPERFRKPTDATEPDTGAKPTPGPWATAAVALAVGASAVGASRGGQGLDSWVERRLTARGVRRPRAWIGVAAAGLSLAMGGCRSAPRGDVATGPRRLTGLS